MKRLYSLAVAMGTAVLASAQLTGLSVDVVMEHDGTVDPSLAGFTTYRVYADLTNEFDFVSAVFGDATYPLSLGCDGTIFQSTGVNYNYANQVNALFFDTFPTTEYDSWLTIGAEDSNGGVNIQSTDDTMLPALNLFNAGEGFIIADPIGASWFNVYPCAGAPDLAACADGNPAFAGADNRVLVAQITADGDIYGIGGNHLIHAMRRNVDMTLIVQNNAVYGLNSATSLAKSSGLL
jgi:pyruvate/2-oxoacid:ferredoxin oxidoreductase beta subunit